MVVETKIKLIYKARKSLTPRLPRQLFKKLIPSFTQSTMVNISYLPLALVAGLAAFGEARNCTPKLNYCGKVLLSIGRSTMP